MSEFAGVADSWDAMGARCSDNLLLLAAGLHSLGEPRLVAASKRITSRVQPVSAERYHRLLMRSVETKVTPMLAALVREEPWVDSKKLQRLNCVIRLAQEVLLRETISVLERLKLDNVDFAVIKGSDYICSIYPHSLPRQMADMDIIIKPHLVDRVTGIMASMAFTQGAVNRDTLVNARPSPDQLAASLTNHYELPTFHKIVECKELAPFARLIDACFVPRDYILTTGDSVFILVQLDVHFNLSFDIRSVDVWSNRRMVGFSGKTYSALSLETQIWFLAARLYVEFMNLNQPALRAFIDLAGILAKSPAIDWAVVRDACETYRLYFALYFVFTHLREIEGTLIPEDMMLFCQKGVEKFRNDTSNKGDFLPAMLEIVAPYTILRG